MLAYSTELCELSLSKYIRIVCGDEGVGWVLSPVGDYILQEFHTLYLTRFRTYKVVRPPQTKTKETEGA
jgi:hypothetical protein